MIKNSENNIQLKNATGYKTVLYGIILILEDMHSQSRAIFNPTNTDMQNMAFLPPLRQLTGFFFLAPKSLHMVIAAMKLKDTCSLKEKL